MLWKDEGRSANLEDRRGFGGRAGLGIGGTAVLLILSLVFGRNFFDDVGSGATTVSQSNGSLSPADSAREEPQVRFVSFVLNDAQATWKQILPQYGAKYHDAGLVLFRGATDTGCGTGQTAMGPFYCPLDEKVYIDLEFYDELKTKFAAAGDFAQAYVIAHELGHHVQHSSATSFSPATSRKASTRPRQWVTTVFRSAPRAASVPNHSRTARRRSARAGSRKGSMRVIRAPVIPLGQAADVLRDDGKRPVRQIRHHR